MRYGYGRGRPQELRGSRKSGPRARSTNAQPSKAAPSDQTGGRGQARQESATSADGHTHPAPAPAMQPPALNHSAAERTPARHDQSAPQIFTPHGVPRHPRLVGHMLRRRRSLPAIRRRIGPPGSRCRVRPPAWRDGRRGSSGRRGRAQGCPGGAVCPLHRDQGHVRRRGLCGTSSHVSHATGNETQSEVEWPGPQLRDRWCRRFMVSRCSRGRSRWSAPCPASLDQRVTASARALGRLAG